MQSQPLCLKDSKFYRQNEPNKYCFTGLDVGREYICPKVGSGGDTVKNMIEQPLHPWFQQQQQLGGQPPRNMGCGCPQAHRRCNKCGHRRCTCGRRGCIDRGQMGGGHRPYPLHKMRYTTTGDLIEYKCKNCYTYTPGQGLGGTPNGQNGGGLDNQSINWPRSTCKKHKACRGSSNCGYVKFNSLR